MQSVIALNALLAEQAVDVTLDIVHSAAFKVKCVTTAVA